MINKGTYNEEDDYEEEEDYYDKYDDSNFEKSELVDINELYNEFKGKFTRH